MIELLRLALTVQVTTALAWGAWRCIPASARDSVRVGRALLAAALLGPLATPLLPVQPPFDAPAQVYAGDAGPTVGVATRATPELVAPSSAAVPAVSAFGLLFAVAVAWRGREAVALAALVRRSTPWKRVHGVRLLLSDAVETPFAAWLGGPIIVLDPATYADPSARLLAVRHELAHHRHGDATFAWFTLVVRAVTPGNPLAAAFLRDLQEAEECAVDAALVDTGVNRATYAELLYATARRAVAAPPCPALGTPSPRLLTRRISMLLHPRRSPPRTFALAGSAAALTLIAGAAWASDRVVADRRVTLAQAQAIAAHAQEGTDFPVVANDLVLAALTADASTPAGRRWCAHALDNENAWITAVDTALDAANLPLPLDAVPFVESGWRNLTGAELSARVPAPQRGAGLWMFIPATAREYGLRVDLPSNVDDRRDPALETDAAVRLLTHDHDRYGDWLLALAAYNQGDAAVDRAIATGGTRDVWALQRAGLLNDYVAEVEAAILVSDDPTLLE